VLVIVMIMHIKDPAVTVSVTGIDNTFKKGTCLPARTGRVQCVHFREKGSVARAWGGGMDGRRDAIAMHLWNSFMVEHPDFTGLLAEEDFESLHGGGRVSETMDHTWEERCRQVDGRGWLDPGDGSPQ
jgi:hypothetical protein